MKIKDERLTLQGLKNIRIAFGFQTLCILGILVYDGIVKGITHITDNPLWLVVIGTGVILAFLNLRISLDVEETKKNKNKREASYVQKIILALAIGVIFGLITYLSPGGTLEQALIIGGVLSACFLLSYSVVHYLRKQRSEDDD
ncbi:branched-chain amino acid ABC transporter substrate-binding protein [Paenibacillus sp. J2TS4]|uniref:branched-chain amino acid ABC transporter substrate-binding protein n=1 Tax=Paenibacillus sp. J2TS4 TaxID=2807194 RepID=UPI001AFCDB69|nr:branched-chain amino acid ABC transporter substrate-binding protein [Paenibacillus sp. J2TS4]GIP34712.1 hypothetical protein J2TS4_39220 [Paenibacillus sp. J2TS4]